MLDPYYSKSYTSTPSYICWEVEKHANGSYLVVGTHTGFLDQEPKREVYQFQTRDWANLCRNQMERLSNNSTSISISNFNGIGFNGGSSLSSEYLSEEYINLLLKTLTLRKIVAHSLEPAKASLRASWKILVASWEKLMWGENGKHDTANQPN